MRIKRKEIAFVFIFYLLATLNHYAVIAIDTGYTNQYWSRSLEYFIKLLLSLPIWWLFYRVFPNISRWKTIGIHLLLLPLFVLIWIKLFYWSCEQLGFFHLSGNRSIWDIYLTALFYITQFGIYHLYVFNKRWREQKQLAAELSQLTTQSELEALKAQLNPHFLYNVFNTIYAAIPRDAQNAREMITQLSDIFRYQLKASKEEKMSLSDEVNFVKKYLDLEKERFAERLEYNIMVNEELLSEEVPPIIIQPIVENAIKHGLSSLVEGGRVDVEIKKEKNQLVFCISDTGVGIGNASMEELLNQGIGLSNTHKRLKKMYGEGIRIENHLPKGTIVRFSIPLNQN